MSDAEDEFVRDVDRWVSGALDAGPSDFAGFLRLLPGVYPTTAIEAVKRLYKKTEKVAGQILISAYTPGAGLSPEEARWLTPVPHPLDYDWRFSPESASALAERLVDMTYGQLGPLLLLGAPSVFRTISHSGPDVPVLLFDRSDTGSSIPGIDFAAGRPLKIYEPASAVLADPPWYADATNAFLWTAAMHVADSAHVVVGIPGLGTRPGVVRERAEMLDFANSVGLSLDHFEEFATEYVTPPFERSALRASGITNVPARWRSGSLAHFQKSHRCSRPPPITAPSPTWCEIRVGAVRWRLRTSSGESNRSPELRSLVAGDVLPSVSRRNPVRPMIDVWTSGNRVFGCENPVLLSRLLRTLVSGGDGQIAPTSVLFEGTDALAASQSSFDLEGVVRQLVSVVQEELLEYRNTS